MEYILRLFNVGAVLIALFVLYKSNVYEKAGDMENALFFSRITTVLWCCANISWGIIDILKV